MNSQQKKEWINIYEIGGGLPEPGQFVFLKLCNGDILDDDMYSLGMIYRENESQTSGYRWLKCNAAKGVKEEFILPVTTMNGDLMDTVAAWRPAICGDK